MTKNHYVVTNHLEGGPTCMLSVMYHTLEECEKHEEKYGPK